MEQLELCGSQPRNASFSYRITLRNGLVEALWLTASECITFLKDFIKKVITWRSGARSLRMLHFLQGFSEDSDQLKLWSSQAQIALRSWWIILRNWPIEGLKLPGSECFTSFKDPIEKLSSWSAGALILRNLWKTTIKPMRFRKHS